MESPHNSQKQTCVCVHEIHYYFKNICQWIFVYMDVLLSEIHKWM